LNILDKIKDRVAGSGYGQMIMLRLGGNPSRFIASRHHSVAFDAYTDKSFDFKEYIVGLDKDELPDLLRKLSTSPLAVIVMDLIELGYCWEESLDYSSPESPTYEYVVQQHLFNHLWRSGISLATAIRMGENPERFYNRVEACAKRHKRRDILRELHSVRGLRKGVGAAA